MNTRIMVIVLMLASLAALAGAHEEELHETVRESLFHAYGQWVIVGLALTAAGAGTFLYRKRIMGFVSKRPFVSAGSALAVALVGFSFFSAGHAAFPEELTSMPVTVYKSPSCGCCSGYISELERRGFEVETVMTDNLDRIKMQNGVPSGMTSCHTTLMSGYVVEGHVPMEAVKKLLVEQPDIDGITLPGMPTGTPGMPGPKTGTYKITAFTDDQMTPFMEI